MRRQRTSPGAGPAQEVLALARKVFSAPDATRESLLGDIGKRPHDRVNFSLALEDAFHITLSDEKIARLECGQIATVGEAQNIITRQIRTQARTVH